MSDQLYKVVEDQTNKTAFAGVSQDKSKPKGVSIKKATSDCDHRNDDAELMGLMTRYKVVEF